MGSDGGAWQPWSKITSVSIQRTLRENLCRVRLFQVGATRAERQLAELVIPCRDEVVGELREYVAACRQGQAATPPSTGAGDSASWASARRALSVEPSEHGGLRLAECPQCGYDLVGLPAKGQCPECGFVYDWQSLIVLYGWRGGINKPMTTAGRMAMFLTFCASIGYMVCILAGPPQWVTYAFPLIFGLLMVLVNRWMRSWGDLPPEGTSTGAGPAVQLRLSPEGYAARYGYGPCAVELWSEQTRLSIRPTQGQTYSIEIRGSRGLRGRKLWLNLDFEADAETVARIRETAERWCKAMTPPDA